ncbi:heterokaryon incompatibility protein-domain-containing protein [Daldinia loculata]|uniref:heterokaryon incompatibility protein-domain-containing protein n=1 Tax=Daldinia loculata TaxID=103429 RepID=UPI0020C3B443|nr:heterokaryon incompatibility protein-domain-containing protein [Daldinia loculata]KAI1641813.1 heterokaryon incompatibility protein-domain-containing protein [Daldinia loculata]
MAFSPLLTYRYPPLTSNRHIRVLEIQHGDTDSEPLKGSLRNLDLDDDMHLPYAALSYTWGQPDFSEILFLDGSIKFITPNLANALRRFRFVGCLKWIWVDAVCINQQDDEEKSFQIPLMTEIYRNASYTNVWLGNEDHSIKSMKFMRTIATRISESIQESGVLDASALSHVISVTQLAWFTRRWVIQELVMSPSVSLHCGPVELSWQQLSRVLLMAREIAQPTPSLTSAISLYYLWLTWSMPQIESSMNPARVDSRKKGNSTNMTNLLHAFEHFDCADPRDRIYSISGLRRDGVNFDINYSYSMGEVFTGFAEAYANSKSEVENLLFWILSETSTRQRGNRVDGLPSWVPDWRIPSTGRLPFEPHFTEGQSVQRSSGNASYSLTMNFFRGPSVHGTPEVQLTVSWAVFRGENEDFPDFIARSATAVWEWYLANTTRDSDAINDEQLWYWVTHRVINNLLPWALAGIPLTDSVSRSPPEKRHELGAIIREFLTKSWPGVISNGHIQVEETWKRSEATTRCFFVALPNTNARPCLKTSVIGIGFSDLREGDRVSAIDAKMKTPERDLPGNQTTAGLIVRDSFQYTHSQANQQGYSTEGCSNRDHTPLEFIGCCYLHYNFRLMGWDSCLSDLIVY